MCADTSCTVEWSGLPACWPPGYGNSMACSTSLHTSGASSGPPKFSAPPGSAPKPGHLFSDADCCRHPLDLGSQLQHAVRHGGTRAHSSSGQNPGDHGSCSIPIAEVPHSSCWSHRHPPGVAWDLQACRYRRCAWSLPRSPASSSTISAKVLSHADILAQTRRWPVPLPLLRKNCECCSTG